MLADLYGPGMPSWLLRAHRPVDEATGFLLGLYEERTRTERGAMMEEVPLFQVQAGKCRS